MKSIGVHFLFAVAVVSSTATMGNAQFLVSDNFGNQIISYDPATGAFVEVLVSNDPAKNGGLNGPVGMLIEAGGDLLVASQNTNSILRYDLASGLFLGEFASTSNGNAFAGPAGIRQGPDGNYYVANFFGNSVDRVAPDGSGLGTFTSGGPGIAGTASFVFGPDGNLYVASFNTGEVQVFDGATGQYIETFASSLPGATGLLFDGSQNLWVASLFTHTVSQFGSDGMLVQSFSTGADTFPSHLVFNPNAPAELLIALTGAAGVFRFSDTGQPLGPFAAGGGLTVPGESLVLGTVVVGDVNGDGVVNLLDVAPFVNVLNTGGFHPAADINQDGMVNLLDVQPFVALLSD